MLVVKRGEAESREKAQRLIMAGLVSVNGETITKPGIRVNEVDEISVRERERYVGRGGYKLEAALERFDVSVKGAVAADIGASTGGFTDCLLQFGAARVYAIDVGYGQLHWGLRNDERVIVREKLNARYLTAESLPEPADVATIDVSFISQRLILHAMHHIIKPQGDCISLVKPQFEAGKKQVPRGGVVKEPAVHGEVLKRFIDDARDAGFGVVALMASPIRGADGNREYLAHLCPLTDAARQPAGVDVDMVVEEAFGIK